MQRNCYGLFSAFDRHFCGGFQFPMFCFMHNAFDCFLLGGGLRWHLLLLRQLDVVMNARQHPLGDPFPPIFLELPLVLVAKSSGHSCHADAQRRLYILIMPSVEKKLRRIKV
jgi:hypothetical protein